jgi:CheY-like chemotaxis protein
MFQGLPRHNIVLIESDPRFRNTLNAVLGKFHNVTSVSNALEAMTLFEQHNRVDLVVVDADAFEDHGMEFVRQMRQRFYIPHFIFTTRNPVENLYPTLRMLRVFQVFVKNMPLNYDDLETCIRGAIDPKSCFGFSRYLPNATKKETLYVRTKEDRRNAMERLAEFVRDIRNFETDVFDIRLSCEELINNSLFHAFRTSTGGEKYRASEFRSLDYGEEVTFSMGVNSKMIAVASTDNQGTLDVDLLIRKLERQTSDDGQMDTSGRGSHLARILSDRMIINLQPRRHTETILLFYHKREQNYKPFMLNLAIE